MPVLVGAGTLRADNPPLHVRDPEMKAHRRSLGKPEGLVNVLVTASARGRSRLAGSSRGDRAAGRIVATVEDAPPIASPASPGSPRSGPSDGAAYASRAARPPQGARDRAPPRRRGRRAELGVRAGRPVRRAVRHDRPGASGRPRCAHALRGRRAEDGRPAAIAARRRGRRRRRDLLPVRGDPVIDRARSRGRARGDRTAPGASRREPVQDQGLRQRARGSCAGSTRDLDELIARERLGRAEGHRPRARREDHDPRHDREPPYLDELRRQLPAGMLEWLKIPGSARRRRARST
mgnify:CR=1 FL=1